MQNANTGDSQNVKVINVPTLVNVCNSLFPVQEKRRGFIVLEELESVFHKFDKNQFEILKEDIVKNGINSPILYIKGGDEKVVVDGHIRLRIAAELNLEQIPELEISEKFDSIDELKIWIVRNQCQRRNLSKNQRVRLAYGLKDSIAALAHKNLSLAAKNGSVELAIDTLLEIAKVAGVGRTTIAKFQFVMEKASAETKHKMVEGDISINNAFEETKSSEKDIPVEDVDTIVLKENYFHIENIIVGKKKIKSGELDCIILITKSKVSSLTDSNINTGVFFLD